MTRSFGLALLTVAALVTACITDTAPNVTSTTTTTSEGVTSPTVPSGSERPLDTVDCATPPPSVAIVCEAYDLILANYVDPISADELAAAAAESLEAMDPAASGEPLVCALPTEAFETTCDIAADLGLDTQGTAEAMVGAMVSGALDPNSIYFDRSTLALLDQEEEGQIEGIGALVSAEDETIVGDNKQCSVMSETCRILVVSTIEGAPAEAAGLQRDDVMVEVDGESILGWTVDEVTARVRGPAGTAVTLTIERAGARFEVTMVRAAVLIPVLEVEQVGATGYIRLFVFSDGSGAQFEEAVVDLLADGAQRLVIDLRDNPGGLLDAAIEVVSVFLDNGEVVVTQGGDDNTSYTVTGGAIVPDEMEVDFLVNKGSASASEVVSAVLQERGRATVLGENTFGKNTVQQRFGLSNGGALRLTIARWLTPGGLDFGGVGVTPDISLPLDSDLEASAVVAAVLGAT